jgi:hypothetical protein
MSLDAPGDVPPDTLGALDGAVAVGEGAAVYMALLRARGAHVREDADASPVAFAGPLVCAGPPVSPEALDLHYLRAPDAVPPGGGPG